MDKFKEGDIVHHKATHKKCVVIKIDGETLKVRDEDDKEHDYYPVELYTETEWDNKFSIGFVSHEENDSGGFGY